ncbi:PLD nuclease N-terminal domain-containing protein [Micromonospora peucetia]|uniref:PLD nuclease N-terminal domain-containing protein n=1 Tax=Micromonospora peucetia TaxID=47871 RepID=A0A1C6U8E2_9ACTN|nr:PLD nuclease N-terminal domain-containing protein [Micromonospora peucetia]MCX4386240.1 PLD nuclease N-terminal domain-containing protein [Micromonospora peucetia]WSA33583.1 PLD nuclease N-terminal domain-containing protein [Micromonospora peucetia]SCL50109.1 Phospholipase_D-nuclease N-terminal [Micromonospora peucetia]
MARLYVLLFVVQIVLAVCALISCLSAEEGEIKALPRIAWVLIILFFPLLGSLAWFAAGRERTPAGPAGGAPKGRILPARERPRPVAPDDDPEFLRSLGERSRQDDQELFSRWEEDLRRREDEMRRRDGEPPREEDRPEGSTPGT